MARAEGFVMNKTFFSNQASKSWTMDPTLSSPSYIERGTIYQKTVTTKIVHVLSEMIDPTLSKI